MLTKNEFRAFREDFKKAVEGLEKKYNLSISLGGITYNNEKFTTRLTATDQRKIKTPEDIFHINAKLFPSVFKPDMYGKLYRLEAINPNARKNYCGVVCVTDQKNYVCAPHFLGLPGVNYQKYEDMIDYILNQATEQTFFNFMGYDMRPVSREDIEEVISQMPEDVFDRLYMDFFHKQEEIHEEDKN